MMQGILGTTSKKPLFYVEDNKNEHIFKVYLGFRKIITVPDNKKSFLFKSIISMLINTGVCISHIEKNFNLSYKTIIKIDDAFKNSKDDAELKNRLKNPGRTPYKINDEIEKYIYQRILYYKSKAKRFYIKKQLKT